MKAGYVGQRFALLLNRLFGLAEQYVVVDVAPDTLPTFDIGRDRFEYRAPRGEVSWSTRLSRALDAANFSFVGIVNPANSGLCICIETVESEAPIQGLFFSVRRNSVQAGAPGLAAQDGRVPMNAGPFTFTGVEAAVVQSDGVVTLIQGETQRCDAVLPPATDFRLEGLAINTAVPAITFRGYLRPCKPDEMAL